MPSSSSLNASASKVHAFIFQDPSKPLQVTNSLISQEYFSFLSLPYFFSRLDGFEDRYRMEGPLGKGNFGEVKLCRELSTGDMYAAKIIDLRQVMYRVGGKERPERVGRSNEIDSARSGAFGQLKPPRDSVHEGNHSGKGGHRTRV